MIYYDEIKNEVEALADMIETFGNCDLSHMEKIALSDQLGDIVGALRIKYELTSGYYAQSEFNALVKYQQIHNTPTAQRIASFNELNEEDFTAKWLVDDYGMIICSSCKATNNPTAFCPRCGKRMTNNN